MKVKLALHSLALLVALAPAALADDRHDSQGGSFRPQSQGTLLGFAETQRVLSAVKIILRGLTPGNPAVLETPQGKRLTIPLVSQGQVVARALILPGGTLAPLRRGPSLPDSEDDHQPALSAAALSRLKTQLQALTALGSVQATPGEYRVILLSAGTPVAALRLDSRTLAPKPDNGLLGRPLGPDSNGSDHHH